MRPSPDFAAKPENTNFLTSTGTTSTLESLLIRLAAVYQETSRRSVSTLRSQPMVRLLGDFLRTGVDDAHAHRSQSNAHRHTFISAVRTKW